MGRKGDGMREIIFRGKAIIEEEFYNVCEFWQRKIIKNGKWIQGDLIWNKGIPFIVKNVMEVNDEYISLEWWMPVDPETIGQYTGLKDKNGKMIFEGDMVRWSVNGKVVVGEVFFASGWFDLRDGSGCIGWDPIRGLSEIIGNIHEGEQTT